MKNQVVVLIGSGAIGQAIVRRVGVGRTILLADLSLENAQIAAEQLAISGFRTQVAQVNIAERQSVEALAAQAAALGNVMYVVNAAGVSPSQAKPPLIFAVDLFGTAVILEVFGNIIAKGGSAVMISSQSGFRLEALNPEENHALATLPPEQLLELPLVKNCTDSLRAYQISKRGNGLRVSAEAVRWGKHGARVNAISPGIVFTPLANDELNGERKDFYQNMLANLPVGRGGTVDEIATLAELMLTEKGGYITGSDFLIDGGATANFFFNSENK